MWYCDTRFGMSAFARNTCAQLEALRRMGQTDTDTWIQTGRGVACEYQQRGHGRSLRANLLTDLLAKRAKLEILRDLVSLVVTDDLQLAAVLLAILIGLRQNAVRAYRLWKIEMR